MGQQPTAQEYRIRTRRRPHRELVKHWGVPWLRLAFDESYYQLSNLGNSESCGMDLNSRRGVGLAPPIQETHYLRATIALEKRPAPVVWQTLHQFLDVCQETDDPVPLLRQVPVLGRHGTSIRGDGIQRAPSPLIKTSGVRMMISRSRRCDHRST